VATAVAFPVAGICVGAYQLGRGLVNSGEAMRCTQLGMLWKEETREWYFYELEKEQLELEVLQAKFVRQNESHASAKERVVTDRSYYDLLQVSTNATNVELKKAYYKMSRQVHPDRNPDDPRAAQKFQELSQAYQTLSNDQARAIYDKHGKSESNELDLADIDPYLFFAVMFGSEAVRPYIGELWIANKADSFMKEQMADFKKMQQHSENENDDDQDDDDSATTDERAFLAAKRTKEDELKQRRREVECALYLRERIAAFMSGMQDESDFVLLAQEEAATITKGCFGDIFCTTIGFALEMEALEFIGTHTSYFGMGGTTARMKLKTHSIGNNMKILGAGIGAARAGSQAYKEMEKMATQHRGLEEQQQQDGTSVKEATEKLEQSLPAFIELAWAINIQDISSLLKTVCHKVFHDGAETHSIEVRLKRAEAVHILGREFHNMGKLAKKTNLKKVDAQELRTRAECAAMQTMAKAQGQDLSGADAESMIRQARAMDAAQRSTAEQ
jgi:curved DNA-binding protein CbpA